VEEHQHHQHHQHHDETETLEYHDHEDHDHENHDHEEPHTQPTEISETTPDVLLPEGYCHCNVIMCKDDLPLKIGDYYEGERIRGVGLTREDGWQHCCYYHIYTDTREIIFDPDHCCIGCLTK